MVGIIGKKIGMTSIFTEAGKNVACTVIQAEPNVVTQVKTKDTDGYNALQLSWGDKKEKSTTKALKGHFDKANCGPKRVVKEYRTAGEEEMDVTQGQNIDISIFEEGEFVDIAAISKGKGFQGVVKRHGFAGVGSATHGQHNRLRAPGSIGACSFPSRVFKGMRMAGRMGGKRVKIQNLQILKLDKEDNLIVVKGAVPGHKGSTVMIEK